ncbi:MAG: hypothetical protein WKF74_02035 [Pyrinomonadaceae bacterium]
MYGGAISPSRWPESHERRQYSEAFEKIQGIIRVASGKEKLRCLQ